MITKKKTIIHNWLFTNFIKETSTSLKKSSYFIFVFDCKILFSIVTEKKQKKHHCHLRNNTIHLSLEKALHIRRRTLYIEKARPHLYGKKNKKNNKWPVHRKLCFNIIDLFQDQPRIFITQQKKRKILKNRIFFSQEIIINYNYCINRCHKWKIYVLIMDKFYQKHHQ